LDNDEEEGRGARCVGAHTHGDILLSFWFGRPIVTDNMNVVDIFEPYSFFPTVAGWGGTACSEF